MTTMTKEGVVVENNKGNLLVSVMRNEACGSCAANGTCGQKKETLIKIFCPDDIKVGDKVKLESKASDINKYSIYVYIFPVIMMVLGAFLANLFFKNTNYDLNLMTLLFVTIFLLISFLLVKKLDSKIKSKEIMKVRKI